ncbi:hypothetical protein HPP92_028706 [Vanilla planifolia]|uniref:Uncharacterized protein n=1 Tax=Vanilla planifolia TaxID=51239 RepID=A0A835U254_VANPL|nr:hypothetical protein HPP92_028706 [Vanilla planifolia]
MSPPTELRFYPQKLVETKVLGFSWEGGGSVGSSPGSMPMNESSHGRAWGSMPVDDCFGYGD